MFRAAAIEFLASVTNFISTIENIQAIVLILYNQLISLPGAAKGENISFWIWIRFPDFILFPEL